MIVLNPYLMLSNSTPLESSMWISMPNIFGFFIAVQLCAFRDR